MADKRKHSHLIELPESGPSSDDELSEKNLRKKLKQVNPLADELDPDSSENEAEDSGVLEVFSAPSSPIRPRRRSTRESASRIDETSEPTIHSQSGPNHKQPPTDYDTYLRENNIEEKRGRRSSARTITPKRSWSSEDESVVSSAVSTEDSNESTKPMPSRRSQGKKKAAAKSKKGGKKKAAPKPKKGDSSSDSDGYEVPPPAKTKSGRGRPAAKKRNKGSSDSSEEGGAAFKKNRRKKARQDEDESDEDDMFMEPATNAVHMADESEDDGFIVDKILARETHTPLEWDKKCHPMHTHYIARGSIFVDETAGDDGDVVAIKNVNDSNEVGEADGIEKFLVKWRNLSYLHVTWETEKELIDYEKNAKGKIQRFIEKEALKFLLDDMQGDEYFNPEFCTVDRILMVQPSTTPKKDGDGFELEYFVKWKALGYDECTWEQEVDVHDDEPVQRYHHFNKEPVGVAGTPTAKRKPASFRPYTDQNRIVFKNNMELRDYQVTGVNWMLFNWYNNRNSLLADEMGLGKTVQTVSVINHLATKERLRGPYLIIAPLSTLSHWQREFTNWTDLNAIVFHGPQDARKTIVDYEFYRQNAKSKSQYRFDVLITTYEMCTAQDYLTLAKIKWQLAVVDEAHRLKNRKSKLATMLEERFKYLNLLLLTGTPLQNNVEELWTLLHFLDNDKFHSSEEFSQLFGDLKDSDQVGRLHSELKPFLLRRMKEDVEKSLAPKEETIIEVELTVLQKQYYRAIYEKNTEFLSRGKIKAQAPSLMNIVMELRKCCNHPFLIRGVEEREVLRMQKEQPRTLKAADRAVAVNDQLKDLLVNSCGKLILLDKLLPRLREGGHRVLIFSQFKIMLNILEDYLRMRGYPRERIDGSITGNDRQAAIDRFSDPQSSSFIMLLSTRAGGVGINLTAADTCIIYDSDWNPQNDLQAQARCHRIGQKKSVKIYRLLTSKTYELHMFHQASMKLGLDQAVLGGIRQVQATQKKKGPSKEEIESLLKYGAYEMFKEDKDGEAEAASKKFSEESVDEILSRSTTVIHDPKKMDNVFSSSFSKATFVSSTNPDEQVALDDPDFWIKVIGLNGEAPEETKSKTPEKRRCRGRKTYKETKGSDGEHENDDEYKYEEISDSSSDDDDVVPVDGSSSSKYTNVHKYHQNFVVALTTFGFGRWTKIRMSDPILGKYGVAKIKEYALGFMVQMLRVACSDSMSKDSANEISPTQMADAMAKMARKFKFIIYWLQVLHREQHPDSQVRDMLSLDKIVVQDELTRLDVVSSFSKSATRYLLVLEHLFLVDQFVSKRLSPMLEVMAVLNEPYKVAAAAVAQESKPEANIIARQLGAEFEAAKDTKTEVKEPETKPIDEKSLDRNDQTKAAETNASIEEQPKAEAASAETTSETLPATADVVVQPESPATTKSEANEVVAKVETPTKSTIPQPHATMSPDTLVPATELSPEFVAKWKHYFGTLYKLPGVPVVEWWQSPADDIRLLYAIHRFGWIRGSKFQYHQIRQDRLIFPVNHPAVAPNAAWPSTSVLNKRVKSIIRYWADEMINPKVTLNPAKPTLKPVPHPAIPVLSNKPKPVSNKATVAAQHKQAKVTQTYFQNMWERRSRFMDLIIAHGIPDVRLCPTPLEQREKWRYFLFDQPLRAKLYTPQELLAEATSLEHTCRYFINNIKPPVSTERSVFGGFKHDWLLTMDQAKLIINRIHMFRLLRRDVLILRPQDLRGLVHNVVAGNNTPSWWTSPDCDILLMQGVECYGLDEHIKEMWLLDLFQKLNPTKSFPNVEWVDGTVTRCAIAVVNERHAHEKNAAVASRETNGMAQEDPQSNKNAYFWYMLQKKEAGMKHRQSVGHNDADRHVEVQPIMSQHAPRPMASIDIIEIDSD